MGFQKLITKKVGRRIRALTDLHNWKKPWIPIIGLASLVWFLIRVIPKPSRAAYPCQRAAFPLASAFVIWLVGIIPSAILIRKAKMRIRQAKYLPALAFVFLAIASYLTFRIAFSGSDLSLIAGNIGEQFIPSDAPNTPVGTAIGVNPGRVVWFYNPDATSWDGVNGYFWDDDNTSQAIVSDMFSQSIDGYTGATSNWDAWDALFKNFNERKGKGAVDYQAGEKIAIKINLNNSTAHGDITHLRSLPTPQLVFALVKQLVESAGVPDTCITLYDNSRFIPDNIYDKCSAAYPGLSFVDKTGGEGRKIFKTDSSAVVDWSQDLVLEEGGGFPTFLPECVSQADYLINLGTLKGHSLAGITICAKNHVGTILATNPDNLTLTPPRAAGFHPYSTVHYFDTWKMEERAMGTYNTLVDLMGHKYLGANTLLFIVDGLYAAKNQNGNTSIPEKWMSEPFNGDWTSSVFISQDNVAIESVCLDFLRSEPTMTQVYGNVDNYLHEAAQANDPPSGTFYDPEGDSIRLGSLGVHEHWNNASDKQYTRNLGTGEGIELLALGTKFIGELTLSVPPGTYDDSVKVEIESEVEGVIIYYTLDGSIPNQFSYLYTGEIVISDNSVLNAIAYKESYVPSSMLSGLYVITKSIGELTLSVPPGDYDDSVGVEIESEVESVNIYYTLDGSIPNQSSSPYTGEIKITENSVLNAIAYKEGYVTSSIVTGSYVIRNTTGIVQIGQNGISINPTLVSDIINLHIKNDKIGDYDFAIYDYSGKLIKTLSFSKTSFNTAENIDVSELNTGSYIVVVRQGESSLTQRIVKQ